MVLAWMKEPSFALRVMPVQARAVYHGSIVATMTNIMQNYSAATMCPSTCLDFHHVFSPYMSFVLGKLTPAITGDKKRSAA
jgi:hypothetical protein